MKLTPEEITDSIYKAYGTDSGVLLGIRERNVVKAIVEFTVNRLDVDSQLKSERERAGKLMEAEQERTGYWIRRCQAAEQCIESSPCDPYITKDQIEAHLNWEAEKKNEYNNKP